MNLYIYSYNNYYNRQFKKAGDTVNDYEPWLHYGPVASVLGFNPGDGVNTTQLIGQNGNVYDGKGNYLIAEDPLTKEIDSRWFIIDVDRTRNGQWQLTLHRDLIADYYDTIIDSPMFIEKATISPDSPFIFNSENMTVNQIKKGEYLLENNLKTPWLVAYLSRYDGEGNYNTFEGEFKYERGNLVADYTLNSESEYKYSKWLNNNYLITDQIKFKLHYTDPSSAVKYNYIQLGPGGAVTYNFAGGYYPGADNWPVKEQKLNIPDPQYSYNEIMKVYNQSTSIDPQSGVVYNSLTGVGTPEGFNELSSEAGKIVKIGDNYFEIVTNIGFADYDFQNSFEVVNETSLYNAMFTFMGAMSGLTYRVGSVARSQVTLPYEMNKISLELKPIENVDGIYYNFTYDDAETVDAVYEVIAAPVKTTNFDIMTENNQTLNVTSIGDYNLQWFQNLASNNSTKVYDVQIVPFIDLDSITASINYKWIPLKQRVPVGETEPTLSYAFKLRKSSFSKLIPVPEEVTSHNNNFLDDVKMGSETELWRITSPNGVGSFDFNPYKNKGFQFIEADCTLMPISPYIKVNPLFNPEGLYGGDYNDYRGLICSGDFSIALTNSEWETYQQQNKNFQNIFNRDIESMELKNKYGRIQDMASIVSGTATGAVSGAMGGAMVGGGVGAVVGAVGGAAMSLGAGIADYNINQALRAEALDYTKDMFSYNLGNIQARAQSLTRTTSFNINNKYFPYIEYYTCTDDEKKAFANKIAWNGMTLMTIGLMSDYISNSWSYDDIEGKGYIKGKLIRMEFPIEVDIEEHEERTYHGEDYHVVNAISGELDKGVYIK